MRTLADQTMPDRVFFLGGGGGGAGKIKQKTVPWGWARVFLEWILQNKAGHLMVFTQCSILNRDSPDVEENRSAFVWHRAERMELYLGREHPFFLGGGEGG